jgi:hypothetical protein
VSPFSSNQLLFASLMFLAPVLAYPAQLRDGTPVSLRLVGVINSDTSRVGQPLKLVVARDVTIGTDILIPQGTVAAAIVVEAQRSRWGMKRKHARLAFRITQTTGRNGRIILLRSSPVRRVNDRIEIDRPKHELLWAGDADMFEAYVDGDYEL